MVRHIVLIHFRPDVSESMIASLRDELRAIESKVPGLGVIQAGRSKSPEKIERGYMHGFTVDFADWDALAAYRAHPDHKALGARLAASAEGGLDGILVFDLPMAISPGAA